MARYLQIKECSIVDGPGVRIAIYFSGCPLHCPGCHNPKSWNPDIGTEFTKDTISEIVEALKNPYLSGLSILGGEPMSFQNQSAVAELISEVKKACPEKSIWIWTGYEWSEIMGSQFTKFTMDILTRADVMVVGRFQLDKRDITKENLWRGSTNQHVILVSETLHADHIVYMPNIPNNN